MAIYQEAHSKGPTNIDVYLPHKGKGHLEALVSGGSKLNLHRAPGSRLSMLINGKQRVNL